MIPLMPDIPDSVISDAVKAVPAAQAGIGSARLVCQIVARAAPVIAAWAREQERDRIRELISQAEVEAARKTHPGGYYIGRQDLAGELLHDLPRADIADTLGREGQA